MSMRFQQTSFKSLDKRLVHIRPWLQDRRKLLRDWVQTNGDASQIEADILLSKSNSSKFGKQRELLTVGEMVAKGWPREKIDAITAKGGIPDEDVPHLPSLYKYWVVTSSTINDTEEVRQEASVRIKAQGDAAAIDAVMSGPSGTENRQALPAGGMDAIMKSIGEAAAAGQDSKYNYIF